MTAVVRGAGDHQAVVSINELLIGFAPRLLLGHVGLQLPFDRFQRLALRLSAGSHAFKKGRDADT